jgi:hypothetical protein
VQNGPHLGGIVDARAIAAVEILEDPVLILGHNAGMGFRYAAVIQHNVVGPRPPDRRETGQVNLLHLAFHKPGQSSHHVPLVSGRRF